MTFRKLLLGSALAIFATGGAAQAADIIYPVAEPIEYVRICDAFGNTYWYSPGTGTCLSITGNVRFDVRFGAGVGGDAIQRPVPPNTNANWRFLTRAAVTINARASTAWGPLGALITLVGVSDQNGLNTGLPDATDRNIELNEAYGWIGNFLFGYTGSLINQSLGHKSIQIGSHLTSGSVDQLRYQIAANGWAFAIALEDPRDRSLATNVATLSFPDVTARISVDGARIDANVAAIFGQRAARNIWGITAGATISIGSATSLRLAAAYSPTGPEPVACGTRNTRGSSPTCQLADTGPGTYWGLNASLQHNFSSAWSAAIWGGWATGPVNGAAHRAAFVVDFTPVDNFLIRGEIGYVRNQNSAAAVQGGLRFVSSF